MSLVEILEFIFLLQKVLHSNAISEIKHLYFQGIMSWNGPIEDRKTFRWTHVCVSVKIVDDKAERVFTVDGEHHVNFTSDIFTSSVWPRDHNFTFGGREIYYYGPHLNGHVADVQIFSRSLSKEEMIGYTTCENVGVEKLK